MDTVIMTGSQAPDFMIDDLGGSSYRLSVEGKGRIVVVNFWSAECPWSQRTDAQLINFLEEWGQDIQVWWIAANAIESLELIRRVSGERKLPIVLHDPEQLVADMYGAWTTPHLYVITREGILGYQGAFDDVTFRQSEVTFPYLYNAVNAIRSGRSVEPDTTDPYGCTIVRHPA